MEDEDFIDGVDEFPHVDDWDYDLDYDDEY
jgi:hypothetical protein